MPLEPSPTHPDIAKRFLSLSGPSRAGDPGHLAVRGDLAHIKLAGQCFVPHYAVPMPHRAKAETVLRSQPRDTADVIASLAQGTRFEVLDIAGAWAWGQVEHDGLVGYVAIADLEHAA